MDIGSLIHTSKVKQRRRIKIYDTLLESCYKKIKSSNNGDKNKCVCVHRVPPFIFGTPVYDLNTAIIYIIDKLKRNGFDVHFTEPNIIHISWKKHVSYYDTSDGTSLELLESDGGVSRNILNSMKNHTHSHYRGNYKFTKPKQQQSYPQQQPQQQYLLENNGGYTQQRNISQHHASIEDMDDNSRSIEPTISNMYTSTSKSYTTKYFKELNKKFLID
jgi:hypothetical protein